MIWWFAQNALIAAILAAIVWPVCRIRRLGPAVRHALWLVVLLKLVTPPLVTWPWSAPNLFEWLRPASVGGEMESVSPREMAGGIGTGDVRPDAHSVTTILPGLINETATLGEQPQVEEADSAGFPVAAVSGEPTKFGVPPEMDSVVPERFPGWGLSGIKTFDGRLALATGRIISLLGTFWLVGTALSILIHAIQVARFLRLVARSEQPSQSLLRQVKNVAATLRVRPPRVVVVVGMRSPVIWGGVRAQLIWPACLPQDFESGRWDGVIAHELAHLRRRDHWVSWLELLAGCVWWWNPLFWYVRHQLRENAELACDALVVWALPDGRRTYAESLIEVVSHFSLVATPVPVLGVNSVARQAFERRLTMILSERVPWKLSSRALLAIGLLALIALPGWSLAQVPSKPPREPAATASPDVKVEASVKPAPNADSQAVFDFFAGVFDSAASQSSSDDQRMEAMEKKLEALIAEVKALSASRIAPAGTTPATVQTLERHAAGGYAAPPTKGVTRRPQDSTSPNSASTARERSDFRVAVGVGSDLQTLSRGQYALPKAKAEALAAFLREHMKSPVEAKVEDDSLIVTASPEAQATIGQFVLLSEGHVPSGAESMRGKVFPHPMPARVSAPADLSAASRADELTFLEHLLKEHPKAAYTEEVEKRLKALRSEKLVEQKRKGSSNELAVPPTTTTKPATNVPAKF